jgi:hypothetical protein
MVGEIGEGPAAEPKLIRSLSEFINTYEARGVDNALLYDSVDTYFREGGKRAYVSGWAASGSGSDPAIEALNSFGKELGPGQAMVIGGTPDADLYGALLDHAHDNNRVALLDVESDSTISDMQALGDLIPDVNTDDGALFGSWCSIPPVTGTSSTRFVPASPVMAALCARVDGQGNPNRAAAGRDFPLQFVTGFTVEPTMAERVVLLDHGVNTFGNIYGFLEMYGFQTAVEESTDNPFWQFNCSRGRMYLRARAALRAENYMFRNIDAQGGLAGSLKTDLDEECLALYQANGLFGETPEEAFAVQVGTSINTVDEIAQGHLHGEVEARFSLHAKAVYVDLVTVPVTGAVTTAS